MFGLFKKQQANPSIDFSAIKTDVHSHIIPALDDGAANIEDSLRMARRYVAYGFEKVIATPHVMADYFKNTPDSIAKGLDVLREALLTNKIALEVDAAAEYYLDENFPLKIKNKEVLGFGSNYLLFELSYLNKPNNLFEIIAQIQDAGFTPVLAHPERYPFFYGSLENYLQITDCGCLLQLNTISLTGYYGSGAKKAAEKLVDSHCISFLGSDMHHSRHADALGKSIALPHVQQLLKSGELKNLLL